MEHFYDGVLGWFDYADVYTAAVARAPRRGAHFVELGAFCGQSAAFLGVEVANSGKAIRVDTWDTFAGLPPEAFVLPDGYARQEALRQEHGSLEAACRAALAAVAPWVTVYRGDAIDAATTYPNASLDLVFLDDDHTAPHVLEELATWWPKLKPGGVLAGHDYDWASVREAVTTWAIRAGVPLTPAGARSWQAVKPQPTHTWLTPPHRRRCLVAVCSNERTVPRHTTESLVHVGWGQRVQAAAQIAAFEAVDFTWVHRYLSVADLRDEAALLALQGDYSHLLFLDADMTWPQDVLARMLRHHGHGIVAGLYHLKAWPHWPVALKSAVWNPVQRAFDYTYDEDAPHTDGLRREELVGMGCTLVPTELFRCLPRPWFKYQQNGAGMSTITEDVWFCQQAATLGCPIWLDPTVVCGHISQQPITTGWFDRSQFERKMLGAGQRLTEEPDGTVRLAV